MHNVRHADCPTPWKIRHDEDGARRQMRAMKRDCRENKKLLTLLDIYECSCGFWHVGHDKFKTARSTRSALRHAQ